MFAHDVAPGLQAGIFRIHTDVVIFCLVLAWGYYLLNDKLNIQPSSRQKFTFYSAIALLWVMSDWPFHDIAEDSSYSIHMIQHLSYTFIFAPMVLLGVHKDLLNRILTVTRMKKIVFHLRKFLPALFINNIILVAVHWPTVVNGTIENGFFHFVMHIVMIMSSLLIWLPIVSPMKEHRYRPSVQMVYLFGQSVLPTIPASFLTFSKTAFYEGYFGKEHIWGIDTLTDQLLAGLIMKLIGGMILWGFIVIIFFRWYGYHEKMSKKNLAKAPTRNIVKEDIKIS